MSGLWIAEPNSTDFYNASASDLDQALPAWKSLLLLVLKIGSVFILLCIMISVGCNISLERILGHLKRPWGILIGITCQFLLLPLVAFGSAHALFLDPYLAIGLLLIASCPGGPMSNLYSLWFDGDVSLR